MKYDIFISYRRDGGDTLAQLIYDRLTARGYRVFLDVESLRSGKFNEKLLAVMDECRDVVVILPPGALERCSNEEDWLYLELHHALKTHKNIIPVMMKGFEWPEKLPAGLEELCNFNGIQDSKDYFDAVIDKMTTLLRSRKILFGKLRNERKKRRDRTHAKETAGGKKKLLLVAAAAVSAAAAAVLIPRYMAERELQAAAQQVDIMFLPDGEMSASDYYDAQDLLKQRLDILADGNDYTYEVEDDRIHVVLPWDVFHGNAPKEILECYVTRPAQLSVIGYYDGEVLSQDTDEESRVDVSRDDIVSLEQKIGSGEEIGTDRLLRMDGYSSLKEQEEYQYLELTLSDEVSRKIRDRYGEKQVYCLAQDVESGDDSWYYYQMLPADRDNTFYIVDNYQEENINRLAVFNYLEEPMPGSFCGTYTLPAEWESVADAQNAGADQVDMRDLEEPFITMQFRTSRDEIAAGEQQDIQASLKRRLDTLEMPYAWGKTVDPDSAYGISVRIKEGRISKGMVELLLATYGLKVEGLYYDLLDPYEIEGLEYEEKEDGTWQFSLILSDDISEEYESTLREIQESEEQDLYLVADYSYRIAKADASEDVDGTRIIFDNLCYLGLDTISGEDLGLLDLLKEVAESPAMSAGGTEYDLQGSLILGGEEVSLEEEPVLLALKEQTKEAVRAAWPDAKISATKNTSLYVRLKMEADEQLPGNVDRAVKDIYAASGLAQGEWSSLTLNIEAGEDGWISISIQGSHLQHCMTYSIFCSGEAVGPWQDALMQILETDPFYKETIRNEDQF